MTGFSCAAAWSAISAEVPDRVAIVSGDRTFTWAEFADRSARLASHLYGLGVRTGDRVGIDCINRAEYIEAFFAALLLGAVPANFNWRYRAAELTYLLDNSDARAVVVDPEFADALRAACADVAAPPVLIETGPDYEAAVAAAAPDGDWTARAPDGDDLIFLYTGGTTGMPKGVMWRNGDLSRAIWAMARPDRDLPDPVETVRRAKRAATTLPACPLMHGTGLFSVLASLNGGGSVVLLERPGLDADAVWDAVARHDVQLLTIVGDAFARPLLAALDAAPARWDLSPLRAITSSGVTWSPEVKRALLAHLPGVMLLDSLGASEGLGTRTATTASDEIRPASFAVNDRIAVLGDDGEPVVPGSGEIGLLAIGGHIPVGYWKDPDKSAATFRTVGGRRWSIPGDFATVEADGAITLLGRGSACVNTGGEKVFPEEVELRLRSHPAIDDVVVVGRPDDRLGEAVVAVVSPVPGRTVDHGELTRWCRETLAGYKCPKQYVVVDTLDRSPAGKADYRHLRALVADAGPAPGDSGR